MEIIIKNKHTKQKKNRANMEENVVVAGFQEQ